MGSLLRETEKNLSFNQNLYVCYPFRVFLFNCTRRNLNGLLSNVLRPGHAGDCISSDAYFTNYAITLKKHQGFIYKNNKIKELLTGSILCLFLHDLGMLSQLTDKNKILFIVYNNKIYTSIDTSLLLWENLVCLHFVYTFVFFIVYFLKN